ncbi:porin [Bordetella trematum]|uniref:porin n=1 Tax=Bordetella trematum TaxID=123899 RepID=UPI000470D41C|nr:porin [Bordetella trematum]
MKRPPILSLRLASAICLAAGSLSAPGSAAAAAANSSVTLYGLVDLGLVYERKNGESSLRQKSGNQSGSRWGLRGSEDLGGGYRAVFRLESGFSANNGKQAQGRMFGRWAYVGLAGDFGELRLGRQWVYGFEWASVGNPFGSGWSQGSNNATLGYNDGDFGSGGRVNNGVFYTTPRWQGWQLGVGYSFESGDDDAFATAAHDRVLTAGLRYNRGPLAAALTYERLNPKAGLPDKRAATNLQLAGSYDLEWIKLYGTYGNLRHPNAGPSRGVERVNSFIAGVSVPVSGSGEVLANYQRATNSDITGVALGYQHRLSKRSNLYAYINRLDIQQSHTLQASLGIRHQF